MQFCAAVAGTANSIEITRGASKSPNHLQRENILESLSAIRNSEVAQSRTQGPVDYFSLRLQSRENTYVCRQATCCIRTAEALDWGISRGSQCCTGHSLPFKC